MHSEDRNASRETNGAYYRYIIPRTDVYQTDKDVIVKSEIPGISLQDIEMTVQSTYIRLVGNKKRHPIQSGEEIFQTEQFYGSFSRVIPLPVEVQPDKAVTDYRDGILSIIIPKTKNTLCPIQ